MGTVQGLLIIITPIFEQGQNGAKEQGDHLVQEEGEASQGDPLHPQSEEGREQDHPQPPHPQHQPQLPHTEGEGVGDKAVEPACSNGMPGSIVQASPGGTSPRTINNNEIVLITLNFEQGQTGEIQDQGQIQEEGGLGQQQHQQHEEGHHHQQHQHQPQQAQEEGALGEIVEAVQSAGIYGMPGSIVQASPGGSSPRTINYNQLLITNTFEAIQPEHERTEVVREAEEGAEGQEVQGANPEQMPEGQGDGRDRQEGVEQEIWVKGAARTDNDRYRSFLDYMEEKREEARQRLQEDEKREEKARRKERSWDLMKEAVKYIKEKRDGWTERRIEECEKIREEEKTDRLALVKEKKKRYGLKRLSKEENSRLKSRTEDRIMIAQSKANLWKRYREGREEEEEAEIGTEEVMAWRNLWNGVKELEEEDAAWRTPEKEVTKMRESKLNHVMGCDKDRGNRKRETESLTRRGGTGADRQSVSRKSSKNDPGKVEVGGVQDEVGGNGDRDREGGGRMGIGANEDGGRKRGTESMTSRGGDRDN